MRSPVLLCGICVLLSVSTTTGATDPAAGSLYPPGLLPLINHANSLLSKGQFNDAAIAYSQAIGEFFYSRDCAGGRATMRDAMDGAASLTSAIWICLAGTPLRDGTRVGLTSRCHGMQCTARSALHYHARFIQGLSFVTRL